MTVEEVGLRLRRELEKTYGAEGASILLDRPPGGWNDLVTNQTLDTKLNVLGSDLRGDMAGLRGEMAEFRGEMRSEMGEFRGDMAEFKGAMRAEMAALSASVDRPLRAQTWIMTTTLIAGLGISAAIAHG